MDGKRNFGGSPMKSDSFFIGLSNQEQGLMSVREVWAKTDKEVTDAFVSMLGADLDDFRKCLDGIPDGWLEFVQDCAVCGLRQAVLESLDVEDE